MAGIHGIIWIIVGALLSVFSKVFGKLQGRGFFEITFYLGIVFGLFGIAKLFFNRSPKEEKWDSSDERPGQRPSVVNCPKCSRRNHTISNFCHMCGHKLSETLIKKSD
ncbi:hypothetical protein ACFL1B_00760 [Nanoarchaeota archaeon]